MNDDIRASRLADLSPQFPRRTGDFNFAVTIHGRILFLLGRLFLGRPHVVFRSLSIASSGQP